MSVHDNAHLGVSLQENSVGLPAGRGKQGKLCQHSTSQLKQEVRAKAQAHLFMLHIFCAWRSMHLAQTLKILATAICRNGVMAIQSNFGYAPTSTKGKTA